MTPVPQLIGISIACWGLFELGLRVRDIARRKGRAERDRGTRVLIAVAFGVAFTLAALEHAGAPAPKGAEPLAGVAVLWLGLATRAWAVVALGASFRTTVEVDAGQAVVTAGPYRWVRHPSYTGLLLIAAGVGLALGGRLSLAACLVLPPLAIVHRIRIEEAELERVLGAPYRDYEARTKRLIPGVW